nr:NTF2- export protein 2 [Polyrhizophydium stewartii]
MNTQLLDVSSRAADTFVPAFYSMFDRQRHALANLYGETSVLVWNGNTTQGAAAIARSYLDFPISDHEVLSYDCQPLTESSDILVTISEICKQRMSSKPNKLPKSSSASSLVSKKRKPPQTMPASIH